jgi:hypothetical protein
MAGMMELPLERIADTVAALRNEVWNCPEHERRSLPRIRVWAPRTIHLVATPGAAPEPLDVWLVDLACGGISFLSARPLEVGKEFTLSLPSMETSAFRLLCRVHHCQAALNGTFNVGGRFIQELADQAAPETLRQAS